MSPSASCYITIETERIVLTSIMKLYTDLRTSLVVLSALIMASMAVQAQSDLCESTFFAALVQLVPCKAAVAPFSPIPPSDACCNAVKLMGQPCLCVLVNGPPISGVDRNMAMQLPDKCIANFEPCNMRK